MTLTNDGNTLGTVALTNGHAILTTSALANDDHAIEAKYAGDLHFVASSTTLAFSVSAISYATRIGTTVQTNCP